MGAKEEPLNVKKGRKASESKRKKSSALKSKMEKNKIRIYIIIEFFIFSIIFLFLCYYIYKNLKNFIGIKNILTNKKERIGRR